MTELPALGRYLRRKDGLVVFVIGGEGAWVRVQVPAPRRRTWEVMACNFARKYVRDDG